MNRKLLIVEDDVDFDGIGRYVGGIVEHVLDRLLQPVGRGEGAPVRRQSRRDSRVGAQHLPALDQRGEPGV